VTHHGKSMVPFPGVLLSQWFFNLLPNQAWASHAYKQP